MDCARCLAVLSSWGRSDYPRHRAVFGLSGDDDLKVGGEFIESLEKFFESLDMPASYKDLGIEKVDIELLANVFSGNKSRAIPHRAKPMDYEVGEEIYMMVKEG